MNGQPNTFSVSIIIVSFNGRSLLETGLQTTFDQAIGLGCEVVVVDNGSIDSTSDYVRERFPEIVIVRNQRNEGFAGGVNAGVRAARGGVIVLLNDDAVPSDGWLPELLRALEPADVAISCSVIDEAQYPSDYSLGTGSISVIGHPIPHVLADAARPFYATGTSLAFKRSVFGEPFDPAYFAYYEDTLLSWRAHLRGLRVARALGSRVSHLGSATADRAPTRALYYRERNKLLTLLLCYEPGTIFRLLPLYWFDGLARLAEDVWHAIRPPTNRPRPRVGLLAKYVLILRGIGWLARHAPTVRSMRARVQAERAVRDASITPLLSGKIFDDVLPTPAHRLANAISLQYCRVVGVVTADARPPRPTAKTTGSPDRPSPEAAETA